MDIQELMDVSPANRDLDWIKTSLQNAVRLEFATIPPYLCGMWSVKHDNDPVFRIIKKVAVDEMRHMGLALNMLVAVGGVPKMDSPEFVLPYPCELPGKVHPGLEIGLVGLSIDVVKNVY